MPSQPQCIISGVISNIKLSPSYCAHKPSNHKFSKIHKISPDKNLFQKNTHTNIKHKIVEELVPSVLLKKKKKAHKAWPRWYRGPFRRFKDCVKRNGQSNKNNNNIK